jgi:hypothetical protein
MSKKERLAQKTASAKAPLEVTSKLTDYLYEQYNKGNIERETVLHIADLLGVSQTQRMTLSVPVTVEVELEVPIEATSRDVLKSLRVHVDSMAFPVKHVDWKITD